MMAIAAWFVRNGIGSTLFLKPGMRPTVADIEFAARNLPSPCVFVIDEAADFIDDLPACTDTIKTIDRASFILLGERLNEWRQRRPSLDFSRLLG
jgi:hypothetical protein